MIKSTCTKPTNKRSVPQPDRANPTVKIDIETAGDLFRFFCREDSLALERMGWSAKKISDGNMNLVIHFQKQSDSFLVKHANPWVERYPSIPAPVERTAAEARFYECITADPKASSSMPKFIGFDDKLNLLALYYIDHSFNLWDLHGAHKSSGIETWASIKVMDFLAKLHDIRPEKPEAWTNLRLRELNHHYFFLEIFTHQYQAGKNGLTGSAGEIAKAIIDDTTLKGASHDLGELYLNSQGPSLLHGDMHPGSVLVKKDEVFIIDPEFCFLGPKEFDLGVYCAHELLLGGDVGKCKHLLQHYVLSKATSANIDLSLCSKFCGIEILRRLLGTAKIPHNPSNTRISHLLEIARDLVLGRFVLCA